MRVAQSRDPDVVRDALWPFIAGEHDDPWRCVRAADEILAYKQSRG